MKPVLTVALRNNSNQILIIETKEGICNFPMYRFEASQSAFKICTQNIREDFGFEIGGITPLRETFEVDGYLVQGMSAYVATGKLKDPLPTKYNSASWIAPSLLSRIIPENESTKHFIPALLWVGGVMPG